MNYNSFGESDLKQISKTFNIWKKLIHDQERETPVKRLPASFPDQIERGSRDVRRRLLSKLLVSERTEGDATSPKLTETSKSQPSVTTNADESWHPCQLEDDVVCNSLPGSVSDPIPPPDRVATTKVTYIDQIADSSITNKLQRDSKAMGMKEGIIHFHKPKFFSSAICSSEGDLDDSLETIYLDDKDRLRLLRASLFGEFSSDTPGQVTGLKTAISNRKPLLAKRLLRNKYLQHSNNSVVVRRQSGKTTESGGENNEIVDEKNMTTPNIAKKESEIEIRKKCDINVGIKDDTSRCQNDSMCSGDKRSDSKEVESTKYEEVKDSLNNGRNLIDEKESDDSRENVKNEKVTGLILVKEAKTENRMDSDEIATKSHLIIQESQCDLRRGQPSMASQFQKTTPSINYDKC